MAGVEPVHTKNTQKPAQKQRDKPAAIVFGGLVLACALIGASENVALLCIAVGAKLARIWGWSAAGGTGLLFQLKFKIEMEKKEGAEAPCFI